jgi:hypothetical protein
MISFGIHDTYVTVRPNDIGCVSFETCFIHVCLPRKDMHFNSACLAYGLQTRRRSSVTVN